MRDGEKRRGGYGEMMRGREEAEKRKEGSMVVEYFFRFRNPIILVFFF